MIILVQRNNSAINLFREIDKRRAYIGIRNMRGFSLSRNIFDLDRHRFFLSSLLTNEEIHCFLQYFVEFMTATYEFNIIIIKIVCVNYLLKICDIHGELIMNVPAH